MSFYTGKNVVVTGAGGLVGHAVVKKLLSRGAFVRAATLSRDIKLTHQNLTEVKLNLMNIDDCVTAVKDMDIVINLAAYLINSSNQQKYPTALIRNNLMLIVNMVEAACQEEVEIYGTVGSSTIYPDVDYPVKECEGFEGVPSKAYTGIGVTWRYCEQACMYYHDVTKTKFAMTRAAAIYGPHDNFDPDKRHVVADLIVRAEQRVDPFEVWGSGHQIRDFVYVDDVADALLLTIEKYPTADPVNIGTGQGTSVKQLVETILDKSGYKPTLTFNQSKPIAIRNRILSVSKAKTVLGWSASTTLEDGIERTIDWYRNEYKTL